MALTADQQATLQLLLERGQGYSDLATLLGEPEPEVRERARAALEQLGGADPDRNAPLTDYLLGQSDPIDRADAVRHLRADANDHRLAGELVATLRELYPQAQLPRLPGEPRQPRRGRRRAATQEPAAGAEPTRAGRLGSGLSQQQTRTIVALASGAVLLIVVVLAITGAFGGDDGESSASAPTETTATTPTGGEDGEDLAVIDLKASSGGNATGEVRIGLATAGQPYADLEIEGLEPAGGDDAYVLWLLLNRETGYPVSVVNVPANGRLTERYSIPSVVAAVAARTKCVDISLASRRELQRQILDAAEAQNPVIPFTGESVLRGAVPGTNGC